ncbi:hypothetical protein [Pseudomonas sp. 2FE]|uniref:hypothetical protein n=1 Tax=Pseudomonas sp. 2FE TaxID=2502190 RepID=UPI0010F4B1C6|nr:hypothetical protein [Pseudomonas sp. 2FE]
MKHQDWERNSRGDRLSADQDDAAPSVQAWLRQRQRPRRSAFWRFATVFGALTLFGFSFYLLAEHSGLNQLISSKTHGLLNPAAPAAAQVPITPSEAPDPYRTPQHFEPIAPKQLTSAPLPASQPLADCIKPGNVIDENVVHCRYGELPRASQTAPSQGMVSPQYLAQYKSDQATRTSAPARQNAEKEVSQAWIRKWDGNGQFLAEWHSLDNRIDSTSVCSNHRRGSIDYRECRKAAKVHFKNECRRWKQRWDSDRKNVSKRMEERYCSAANGFSPMG